jgi:Zn finger protein HypA/HybF involved in hydrogenase expression
MVMLCMDCSLNFGAPAFLHKLVGSSPNVVKKCPRCNSKRIQSDADFRLEVNEVVYRYLKQRYPHFKYGMEVKST